MQPSDFSNATTLYLKVCSEGLMSATSGLKLTHPIHRYTSRSWVKSIGQFEQAWATAPWVK